MGSVWLGLMVASSIEGADVVVVGHIMDGSPHFSQIRGSLCTVTSQLYLQTHSSSLVFAVKEAVTFSLSNLVGEQHTSSEFKLNVTNTSSGTTNQLNVISTVIRQRLNCKQIINSWVHWYTGSSNQTLLIISVLEN